MHSLCNNAIFTEINYSVILNSFANFYIKKVSDLNKVICILLIIFSVISLNAQEKYWIFFRDKKDVSFDPYTYFDARTIEKRVRLNLPLITITDLPLNDNYVNKIKTVTGNISSQSRWLNAVSVKISDQQLEQIKHFEFVKDIRKEQQYEKTSMCLKKEDNISGSKLELLVKQTERMGQKEFEEHCIDGKGVRIAVFDGGFPGVDTHPCFKQLRTEGRIINTYDFVKKRDFVYTGISHGTMVLSCIAGIYKDEKMGLATGAEFLLARTERKGEVFSEEENWLAAVEWADKNGADIINSSLGYTYKRYFPIDMDGKTSLVAKAANIAAAKGILVVNAMGNDGNKSWEFLGTPADADSIISVGGIDPETDYHISFSSYGPTSDMRRKPNVSAYGEVIAAKESGYAKVQGTSFSSPLVAGFAACVMQLHPELNNLEIFKLVEHSGHLYPYYDYAHGYGIPQAHYFFSDTADAEKNIMFQYSGDTIKVLIPENISLEGNRDDILLYFHLEDKNGVLERYSVIEAYQHEVLKFLVNGVLENKTLRVHFRGTTIEHKFD